MAKIIICGLPRKGDYIMRYKGHNTYHRVPAKSLEEAKRKMQKGTTYNMSDIEKITPAALRRYKDQSKFK